MYVDPALTGAEEIAATVAVVPVPVFVADFTPLLDRFEGWSPAQIREALTHDHRVFLESLRSLRIIAVSPEWERTLGNPITFDPPPSFDTLDPAEFPSLHATLVEHFVAPFLGISSIVAEHSMPTLDGEAIVRSYWEARVVDGKPRYDRVVVVHLDVTDLRATQRSLEQAIEGKDRFVASLSHELRNPLTSVLGMGTMLRDEWDSLTEEERREMVELLTSQTDDAVEILDDVLANSAGESLRVSRDRVDLNELLESLDFSDTELEVEPGLWVTGDGLRIRQIVRNLLSNAARHGGQVHRLVASKEEGTVRVVVSDDGDGLRDEMVDHLFEPYAHHGGSGSTGLGLSVSRSLARAMGGDLRYRRGEGWTEFVLDLPAA